MEFIVFNSNMVAPGKRNINGRGNEIECAPGCDPVAADWECVPGFRPLTPNRQLKALGRRL